VSRTHGLFALRRESLLIAKFVPGFDTVAPPLQASPACAFCRSSLVGRRARWVVTFGGSATCSASGWGAGGTADRLGGTLVLVMAGLIAVYVVEVRGPAARAAQRAHGAHHARGAAR
jgi:hypothetical protein